MVVAQRPGWTFQKQRLSLFVTLTSGLYPTGSDSMSPGPVVNTDNHPDDEDGRTQEASRVTHTEMAFGAPRTPLTLAPILSI